MTTPLKKVQGPNIIVNGSAHSALANWTTANVSIGSGGLDGDYFQLGNNAYMTQTINTSLFLLTPEDLHLELYFLITSNRPHTKVDLKLTVTITTHYADFTTASYTLPLLEGFTEQLSGPGGLWHKIARTCPLKVDAALSQIVVDIKREGTGTTIGLDKIELFRYITELEQHEYEENPHQLPLAITVNQEGIKATKGSDIMFWLKDDGDAFFSGTLEAAGGTFTDLKAGTVDNYMHLYEDLTIPYIDFYNDSIKRLHLEPEGISFYDELGQFSGFIKSGVVWEGTSDELLLIRSHVTAVMQAFPEVPHATDARFAVVGVNLVGGTPTASLGIANLETDDLYNIIMIGTDLLVRSALVGKIRIESDFTDIEITGELGADIVLTTDDDIKLIAGDDIICYSAVVPDGARNLGQELTPWNAVHTDWFRSYGQAQADSVYSFGNIHAVGDITAGGSKTAIVDTENYGKRKLYMMEAPDHRFCDMYQKVLSEGEHWINLNTMFAETISSYHLMYSVEGDGSLIVKEKKSNKFLVRYKGDRAYVSFLVYGMRKDKESMYMEAVTKDYALPAKQKKETVNVPKTKISDKDLPKEVQEHQELRREQHVRRKPNRRK